MLRTTSLAIALLALVPAAASAQAGGPQEAYYTAAGPHDLTVPAGVDSVHVVLVGGRGGGANGGTGARVEGDVAVTPGQTLRAVVGAAGAAGHATNGGGEGGTAGGGGATDLRLGGTGMTQRVAVAAGGGGEGATGVAGGGAGATGAPGAAGTGDGTAAGGGGGGTGQPGTGGAAPSGTAGDGGSSGAGGDGALFLFSTGFPPVPQTVQGGGGGGGLFGGGGGGADHDGGAGGGAGSSLLPANGSVAPATDTPRAILTYTARSTLSVLSSTTVAFAPTEVGFVAPDGGVTVRNDGPYPISGPLATFSGPAPGDFATGGCATDILPGATCGVAVRFVPTTAGERAATLVLDFGARSGPVTLSLSGTGLAPAAGTGTTGTMGTAGSAAPRLTGLRLDRSTFRTAKRPRGASRTVRRGARVTFALSAAAEVRFRVTRRAAGRRAGGRCRKPTRATRKRPRCTRSVVLGTLRRSLQAGPQRVALPATINGRRLRPGRYELSARATDPAGRRSAADTAAFRVVR